MIDEYEITKYDLDRLGVGVWSRVFGFSGRATQG